MPVYLDCHVIIGKQFIPAYSPIPDNVKLVGCMLRHRISPERANELRAMQAARDAARERRKQEKVSG